jgi:outer membrane receptor protein involved in Fe transport
MIVKPITKPLPLIGLLLAMPALGAEEENKTVELSEVVVSADYRPKTAQKTAVSLTEIDKDTIEARGAQHLEEVLNLAPNVSFASGASRGQFFQIRGMGEDSQYSSPINPSVGLIIDGIDFSRIGGAATLFDIDSVEVLRGPQGTKFGNNGLAGTINLRSKEPTKDFKIHFESAAGNYDTQNVGFAVGGSITDDTLLGRLAIYNHQSDGYVKNVYLGRDDTQDQNELTLRGKLKWLATENLTVDLTYLHLNIRNGYDAFTLDNSGKTRSNQPGSDNQETNALALKANWQASDAVILQSQANYLHSDVLYSYDADWTAVSPDYFERFNRKRENYSFDVRALSDKAGRIFGGTTDWTVGLFHYNQKENFQINSNYYTDPNSGGHYETDNTALYGQLDTYLSEKLTLTNGLRLEHFKATLSDATGYDDAFNLVNIDNTSVADNLFGGKIGLNYQANEDHLLYTTLSRGFKAGGVNNDGRLNSEQRNIKQEYNVSIETGIKSSWLNKTLITTLSVFYTERNDAQIKASKALSNGTFLDYINNASNATHQGLEASFDWFATDKLRILGSLGLLDAKFRNHVANGVSFDGRQVANAPRYTFNLGSEFYANENLTLRANVEGKDEFYFSDSHNAKSDAYALVNASLDYKHDKHWKVSGWVRNLFDKDYATRGFYFPNNPANNYTVNEKYIQYGQPRVAGITVSYDY